MAMSRVHLFVSGRVQGVMFRDEARREAIRLGVKGWVRNLVDGRVEMVIEGDHSAVQSMVSWSHRGPSRARVERVEVQSEDYLAEYDSFEVESTEGW